LQISWLEPLENYLAATPGGNTLAVNQGCSQRAIAKICYFRTINCGFQKLIVIRIKPNDRKRSFLMGLNK